MRVTLESPIRSIVEVFILLFCKYVIVKHKLDTLKIIILKKTLHLLPWFGSHKWKHTCVYVHEVMSYLLLTSVMRAPFVLMTSYATSLWNLWQFCALIQFKFHHFHKSSNSITMRYHNQPSLDFEDIDTSGLMQSIIYWEIYSTESIRIQQSELLDLDGFRFVRVQEPVVLPLHLVTLQSPQVSWPLGG